jgi:hypothetical protein
MRRSVIKSLSYALRGAKFTGIGMQYGCRCHCGRTFGGFGSICWHHLTGEISGELYTKRDGDGAWVIRRPLLAACSFSAHIEGHTHAYCYKLEVGLEGPAWRRGARLSSWLLCSAFITLMLLLASAPTCQAFPLQPGVSVFGHLVFLNGQHLPGSAFGCVYMSRVFLDVNRVGPLDLYVSASRGACQGDSARGDGRGESTVKVGGRVTAELYYSGPGELTQMGGGEQLILSPQDSGNWSWQLCATRPGNYALSLILTVSADDGKYVNARISIPVHVAGTWRYYLHSAGSYAKRYMREIIELLTALGVFRFIQKWWQRSRQDKAHRPSRRLRSPSPGIGRPRRR